MFDSHHAYHLFRMVLAAAICTAVIGYGLFARRKDESRRWLFVAAGILCSAMTALTIILSASSGGYPGHISPVVFLLVGVAILLPAAALVAGGRRGVYIGDHPHCRHCGFDLFGKPPESTRCGECGSDLSGGTKAVTIGVHHVRRTWILAGIFLAMMGVMLSGTSARRIASDVNLASYKPVWWLLRDLDSSSSRREAGYTLARKLARGELSASQAQQVAERALQDLESGRGSDLIYTLLQLIDQHDLLDEATTRRIMRQTTYLGMFQAPPVIGRGQPFALLDAARTRALSEQSHGSIVSNLDWSSSDISYHLGKFDIPEARIRLAPVDQFTYDVGRHPLIDLRDEWEKVPDGRSSISRDMTLHIKLKYRGKLLEETVTCHDERATRVMSVEEAALALVEPTADDRNTTWSATVYSGGEQPVVEVARSDGGPRVVARVFLTDAQGRRDIGLLRLDSTSNGVILAGPLVVPAGDFTLELVPAPNDGAADWDRQPILNQKIIINAITRSPGKPETMERWSR